LGLQLYQNQVSLQLRNPYHLLPDPWWWREQEDEEDRVPPEEIPLDERLAPFEGLSVDVVTLFVGGPLRTMDPELLHADTTRAVEAIAAALPDAEIAVVVQPSAVRTTWHDEDILLPMVVADVEGTTPWIRSPMVYDLFEDASGAYGHDEL